MIGRDWLVGGFAVGVDLRLLRRAENRDMVFLSVMRKSDFPFCCGSSSSIKRHS
jgi:hypothetical protein